MTLTMVRLFLIIAIYAKSVQNITKEAWMCCHSHSIYACTGIWYSEMLKSLLEIMLWTILWRSMIIWNYFEISNMLCCKLASSRTSSEHLLGLTKVCCMVKIFINMQFNFIPNPVYPIHIYYVYWINMERFISEWFSDRSISLILAIAE